MHLRYDGVNDAFQGIVQGIHHGKIPVERMPSRNGDVLMIPEPLIITYRKPRQRVSFNQARDANPFFHLYEALWMLAGRNDVASLSQYTSKMAQYSDNGRTFNGAYGWRWRKAGDFIPTEYDDRNEPTTGRYTDQLDLIVNHLKAKPESRRAVLQMWNVEDDLLKVGASKDVCCNLSACFSIRDSGLWSEHQEYKDSKGVLDMTVFNRSNDLILGTLGANIVHFSILQEYLAARLGVGVGTYHQISNNAHVYESNWHPSKWIQASVYMSDYYTELKLTPLVCDPAVFEAELPMFVEFFGKPLTIGRLVTYKEPFLERVAKPMFVALAYHKEQKDGLTDSLLNSVEADDWRFAAIEWIARRRQHRANKVGASVNEG